MAGGAAAAAADAGAEGVGVSQGVGSKQCVLGQYGGPGGYDALDARAGLGAQTPEQPGAGLSAG